MVRISDLYALQEIDSQIDALERTISDLRAKQQEDESVETLEQRTADLEATLLSARKHQHSAGDDVEDGRAHVVAVEGKLYGGSVTNSKELGDLQRELDSLQRQQAAREEVALAALESVEAAEAELDAARSELQQGHASWQAEHDRVGSDIEDAEQQIATLRERRQLASRPVDAATLALYERLRRMRAGRAVALVQRGACLGCRIALPSQVFQKARSGLAVVQCTSCERILYVR